jgi:hypothetical protein
MNEFPKGCKVRCERDAPAKGSWAQFDGKVGTVRIPDNDGEVGVVFGSPKTNNQSTFWFLPSELVRVR